MGEGAWNGAWGCKRGYLEGYLGLRMSGRSRWFVDRCFGRMLVGYISAWEAAGGGVLEGAWKEAWEGA